MEGWGGQLEAQFFWSDVLMFCLPALPGGGGECMYVHFDILDMYATSTRDTSVPVLHVILCDTFSHILGFMSQVAELPVSITATKSEYLVCVGKGDRSLLSSVHLRCLLSSLLTPDNFSF